MKTEFKQGGVSYSFDVAPSALREDPDHVAHVLATRREPDFNEVLTRRLVPGGAGMHMHRPRKNRYVKRSLDSRNWRRKGGRNEDEVAAS